MGWRMSCTKIQFLVLVHLMCKAILVTEGKFETFWSVLQWWPFGCILVHFGSFWCTSSATPWPLHDLLGLLSTSKCPFNPKMDHISHSWQNRNNLLCHAMETTLVHFDQFWCLLVHLMCDPMTPPWHALSPILFQVSIQSKNGSY